MTERAVVLLPHGIELIEGVEVQELDACYLIDILLRRNLFQIIVHRLKGDRIAIGTRIAEYRLVVANKHEVNAPGVDTDTGNLNIPAGHFLQPLDDLKIEGIDIPIVVTALNDEVVGETGHLLQFKLTVMDLADNGPATRGT